MSHLFSRTPKRKRAQTLVEYAMVLAIISVIAVAVMFSMATNMRGPYSRINSGLASGQANH